MTDAGRWFELCALSDIADPGSRGFDLDIGDDRPLRLFVVQKDGQVSAFVNRCPHTGAPLEWTPDQFFDYDNSFIQCAIHGALFRAEDGLCVRGPCVGSSLEPLALTLDGGRIRVVAPEGPQLPSS